ncbi:methylenetetrahydrofolate reductase [Thermodesulfovibrio yellowstonii]|uniref:methylenetetrahydrofolate reductase n=1 Tax=Thermodesulfovibrio yellowstonii TaxID=28262 RepID=UPI0024B36D6C|nr:methylenetetrahydrofolate reductase [Thermodesulfovibrio yellowstonii]MDI6864777.1 methylenetetrahydrofolate reductase [Thermodesulfovibrio yellowstonii]
MSNLRKKLMNGDFVITVEITPPKGPDITGMVRKLEELKTMVDAVNFTDNPSARMRLSSLAACKISMDVGFEPVLQMACRDRNRLAIQSDLLGAHALGIRNLLVMTGDHPVWGDHKEAKPVYDIDSSILVKLVGNLNNGLDINGNKLNGKTEFFCGAVVNPNAEPLMPQLKRFEQKLKMGAEFFQTQMIFETEKLERFIDYSKKFNTKVIAGIVLIRTKKMLHYLASKVPGVVMPCWLIEKIERLNDEDVEKFGVDFAGSIILNLMERKLCNGIHIMAFSKVEEVKKILNFLNIRM